MLFFKNLIIYLFKNLFLLFNINIFFSKINHYEKNYKLIEYKNNSDRLNYIDTLIEIYPDKFDLYLEKTKFKLLIGDSNYTYDLNKYHILKENYFKKHNLNNLKIEILPKYLAYGSFGNLFAIYNYILAKKMKLSNDKQIFIFVNKEEKQTNSICFDYFEKYINTIEHDNESTHHSENFIKNFEIDLGYILPFENFSVYNYFAPNILNQYKEKNINKDINNFLTLKKEHYEYGINKLKEIKIPNNAWYVTLHVREPSTYNEKSGSEDWRNADIKTYIKSVKYITDQGGYVFRMGDPSMTKLPKMKNVIDYAHSNIKSKLMDIFLGATCKFLIGTSSGYWIVPAMFNTPVLMSNTTQSSIYYALNKNDVFLPRRIFHKNRNKYSNYNKPLSLKELMSDPYATSFSKYVSFNLNKNDQYFTSNTEDEILAATKLLYFRSRGKIIKSKYKEKYIKILNKCAKSLCDRKIISYASIPDEFFDLNPGLLD
tara:strand:- start:169 stop:1623 length:1455 start_codon:yes stop_codon:yes gene_type:complete